MFHELIELDGVVLSYIDPRGCRAFNDKPPMTIIGLYNSSTVAKGVLILLPGVPIMQIVCSRTNTDPIRAGQLDCTIAKCAASRHSHRNRVLGYHPLRKLLCPLSLSESARRTTLQPSGRQPATRSPLRINHRLPGPTFGGWQDRLFYRLQRPWPPVLSTLNWTPLNSCQGNKSGWGSWWLTGHAWKSVPSDE